MNRELLLDSEIEVTTSDKVAINTLHEVSLSCLNYALSMAKSLNKVNGLSKDRNKGLAEALHEVSNARCMHYTGLALNLLIENNFYDQFPKVIPFCTEICNDSSTWEYHFLLLIQLPSGSWTYLSPGNYSAENINNQLAFNGSTFSNLQDLLMHLEKTFEVKYPIDSDSIGLIIKDFGLMIRSAQVTIDQSLTAGVDIINFPFINYDKNGSMELRWANIHLPIHHS